MHKSFFIFFLLLVACTPSEKNSQSLKAELFFKIDALLGEGPIWNHQTNELFWVDIEGRKVHILDPYSKTNRSFETPSRVGTIVPMQSNAAAIALQDGLYQLDLDSGNIDLIVPIDATNTETRLNDGKADPAGRFWVGGMHMPQTEPAGSLFMVSSDATLKTQLDSVTISNGIVWTADQATMYYIDSPTGLIRAFDYDITTGNITNQRTVVTVSKKLGVPDGMAIDEEDKLWVGLWGGNTIIRFDPLSGQIMEKVAVPAHNVTACAFGGKNLDSLFITTASLDMSTQEQQLYPDAGSIFVVVPGVKGVKSPFYNYSAPNQVP